MKSIIIVSIFILFPYCIFAQVNFTDFKPRIIYTSNEVLSVNKHEGVKNCRYNPFTNNVVVIYANGNKKNVPVDSIWGYQPRNEYPIRIIKGSLYRMISVIRLDNIDLFLFSKHVYKSSAYFFCLNLSSEVYPLSKSKLKEKLDEDKYKLALQDKTIKRKLFW